MQDASTVARVFEASSHLGKFVWNVPQARSRWQ
jgi:hypothetical protein